MSSDATPDQHAWEGYLQRAELLADLGRYDEAAGELGYAVALDPANVRALTMLAKVHLAARRPADALTAADSALAAAPTQIPAMVLRGLALADLRQFPEAAQTAERVLALGPDNPYAQRSGAAILAESRNGQQALNAAWRGVELAPEEPQAHLVLGLVSARLELFDLAERAYREALRLDPTLIRARHDMGVIRLEQRRYAEALEQLAETVAPLPTGTDPVAPDPTETPGRVDRPGPAGAVGPSGSAHTAGAGAGGTGIDDTDGLRSIGDALVRLVGYAAGYSLVAAVIVAFLAAGSGPASRVWAAFMAVAGFLIVWVFAAKVPGSVTAILPRVLRSDRALALAVYAVVAAPCLFLLYALIGTPWPLVVVIAATAVAEFAVLSRTRLGG